MTKITRSTSVNALTKGSARGLRGAIGTCIALALSVASQPVQADGTALDCPSSSEAGQRLRDKNKYIAARAMFRACSQPSCPSIVRKDCAKSLAELDEVQPSIVIAAQDAAGADLAAVRVKLDGREVASRIDGSPIAIDPGEHTLRIEADAHAPLSQHVIVRVNEKNRIIRALFDDGPKAVLVGPPKKTESSAEPPSSGTRTRVVAIVLTAVGALSIGSFAYFGFTSKSDLDSLRSECSPYCEKSKVDDVKSKLLVADVSLGVGIVTIGVAAVLFLTSGPSKPAVATQR